MSDTKRLMLDTLGEQIMKEIIYGVDLISNHQLRQQYLAAADILTYVYEKCAVKLQFDAATYIASVERKLFERLVLAAKIGSY